jgi:GntR family transcriptional regulator
VAQGEYEDTRPRHEQIAAELRAEIMCGDLAPGDKLAGLHEYAEERFNVAIATVQRAIALLNEEGYVTSAPGKRSTVRQGQPIQIQACSWLPLSEDGYSFGSVTLSEDRPPADAAAALGLAAEEKAVTRHRVMSFQGVPAEASWAYYRTSLAHGTELMYPKRLPRGGVPRVFADLGLPYKDPEDTLSWREPTTAEASLLRMPPHVPVLRALRVFRDRAGTPTEVSVLIKPGHLYEMKYQVFES